MLLCVILIDIGLRKDSLLWLSAMTFGYVVRLYKRFASDFDSDCEFRCETLTCCRRRLQLYSIDITLHVACHTVAFLIVCGEDRQLWGHVHCL